jgi:hypothetical protein
LGDSRLLSESKYPFLGGFSRARDRTPPFVALGFRYQHNPSDIPAPMSAQRKKSGGNYLRYSYFYYFFYNTLHKLITAISLRFAIKSNISPGLAI